MPAVALSRVAARVVESGPDGEDLAPGAWQRLEALPDPRSRQGRVYPLACLIAIAVCAFTAAGNDRFTAVGQWIKRAGQAEDRKSTRLNSSHTVISYAVFCLKKKKKQSDTDGRDAHHRCQRYTHRQHAQT